MTIKELVRFSRNEEDIVICNGSLRRKDIVYNGSVEDIPNDLLNCIIHGWKVSLRDILNQHSYCLFVQIDDKGFNTTNESRNRRTISKKHLRNMSNYESLKRKRSKHMNERYIGCLHEGPTKAYPGDIGPSNTTLDKLFKNLTPNARDMEFLKDNYGIDTFDVRWHSPDKEVIDIFATMMSEDGQYRADETFYVYESKKYHDSYVLGTEELGVRIIDKISEVWDLVSVCLRKQLK